MLMIIAEVTSVDWPDKLISIKVGKLVRDQFDLNTDENTIESQISKPFKYI